MCQEGFGRICSHTDIASDVACLILCFADYLSVRTSGCAFPYNLRLSVDSVTMESSVEAVKTNEALPAHEAGEW